MAKQKRFGPKKKIEIVREYLENNVQISQLAERYEISPNLIYYWKKQLFEGAIDTFKQSRGRQQKVNQQIKKLEDKLQQRDSLISEIVSENIKLKKNLNGEN